MNRLLCLFLLSGLSVFRVSAQRPSYDLSKLDIQWEVVENSFEGKSQCLSAFTFTNKSNIDFPGEWELYFNFARNISRSLNTEAKVDLINGDLFRLSPASGWKGIKPGASWRVEFVASNWVVNYTDGPMGLYFVWSDGSKQTVSSYSIKPSTEPKQYLRFPGDKIGLITPEIIYNQNKSITDVPHTNLPKIFPTPLEYRETKEQFEINTTLEIVTDPAFRKEATYLANSLSLLLTKMPKVVTQSAPAKKGIVISMKDMVSEGYELSVTPNGIAIAAADGAGVFYAIQSLKMLVPPESWAGPKPALSIPTVDVKDAPRFAFRSFFIDVARNFQDKNQIKRLLNLMSLYKLNVLHFHLTEDEGWRLEIPSLPELTEVGSRRGHTLDSKAHLPPSFGSGPDVKNSFGSGYYSKSDFIELLRFANERHIKVIPEIESPGHARAAIKSMDARYEKFIKQGKKDEAVQYLLRDLEDKSAYRSVQGWNDNVINLALPSTYSFMEKVTDELVAMYKEAGAPLTTIHFGGDEVPAGVWEKSPAFLQLMKENPSIKSTDDLWYYYYGKVSEMLKKRGLFLSGWEEIGMRKTMLDGNRQIIPNPDFVNDNFQVNVWNNVLGWGAEDLAYQMANAGYKVVLSCVSNLYFDMAYYKDFQEPGYYWGSFTDVDKPFYFIPYDYFKNSKEDRYGNALDKSIFIGKERLTDYGKSNIVGMQGLIWSETIQGPQSMEYMILPKMLGLVERAWSKDPSWATEKNEAKAEQLYNEAWSSFANTLGKRELPRLDYYGGGFNYRIPSPGAIVESNKVISNVQLPGLTIRYTTDGKEPTIKSKIYSGPLAERGTIKLKAFNSRGRSGRTTVISNPK